MSIGFAAVSTILAIQESGTASTVKLPYNTETGVKASTTGNITGIYDMSGGLWEYMAAYSGVGSSGLTAAELIAF